MCTHHQRLLRAGCDAIVSRRCAHLRNHLPRLRVVFRQGFHALDKHASVLLALPLSLHEELHHVLCAYVVVVFELIYLHLLYCN